MLDKINVSYAQVEAIDLDKDIVDCSDPYGIDVNDRFIDSRKVALADGDINAAELFSLLIAATSLHLEPDHSDGPFVPMLVSMNGRTAMTDDFTVSHASLFATLAGKVQHKWLKTRLADIAWLVARDHASARTAVAGYIEMSRLGSDESFEFGAGIDFLTRAIGIARQLGVNSAEFGSVISRIEEWLAAQSDMQGFVSLALMRLLLNHRIGDPVTRANYCEMAAEQSKSAGDFHVQRQWLDQAQSWHQLAKDEASARRAGIASAESYVDEASAARSRERPSHFTAASLLNSAIGSLQKFGDTKDRRAELFAQMTEDQIRARDEMATLHHEFDISQMVEGVTEALAGDDLMDCLTVVARLYRPIAIDTLRKNVEDRLRDFPLQSMMGAVTLDENGRVVSRRGGVMPGDMQPEAVIKAEMYKEATYSHLLVATGLVRPALHIIQARHRLSLDPFLQLCKASGFVPPGHEAAVAQGLLAGAKGDFLVAVSTLIPQIEACCRFVLNQLGHATLITTTHGVQKEIDLNTLLYPPHSDVLTRILGEDLVFDLRGLLVEESGSNLRNRVAHALVHDEGFYSPAALYFWWIMLRLCVSVVYVDGTASSGETEE